MRPISSLSALLPSDQDPVNALVNLEINAMQILIFYYLPGERFAMTEMKMAVVKLLQKFKVEFDETTKIELLKGDLFLFSFPNLNIRFIRR